jgi:mannonate dehydratase
MAWEFGAHIQFVHFRQVRREPDASFPEAEPLAGISDMVGVIRAVLEEGYGSAWAGKTVKFSCLQATAFSPTIR